MKGIIRFLLVLALGAVIGYLAHDAVAEKIEGTKIEETANAAEKATNEFIDEQTAKDTIEDEN